MSVLNYPAACIDEERFTAGRRLLLTGNTTPQAHTHTHKVLGTIIDEEVGKVRVTFCWILRGFAWPCLARWACFLQRETERPLHMATYMARCLGRFVSCSEGGGEAGWYHTVRTSPGRDGFGRNGLGVIYRDGWEGRWDLLGMDGQRRDENGLGLGYVVEVMKNKSLRLLLAGLFIVPVPVPSIWNRRVPTACHLDISYLLRPSFPRRLSKTAAAASLRPPPRQASTMGQETEQRQPCRRPRP